MHGGVLMWLSLLIPLFIFVFTPSSIWLRAILAVAALAVASLLILVLTFFNAAYESYQINRTYLPTILQSQESPIEDESTLVCLLEPSRLFSYDIWVSFYTTAEHGFETLIGIGTVINIQEDGKIQVGLIHSVKGHEDAIQKLRQNDAASLKATVVKPTVPAKYLNSQLEGGQ